jgi:hypothetical protein
MYFIKRHVSSKYELVAIEKRLLHYIFQYPQMVLFLVSTSIHQLCINFRLAITLPASSHSVCAYMYSVH